MEPSQALRFVQKYEEVFRDFIKNPLDEPIRQKYLETQEELIKYLLAVPA